jgi:hypothetical protein
MPTSFSRWLVAAAIGEVLYGHLLDVRFPFGGSGQLQPSGSSARF